MSVSGVSVSECERCDCAYVQKALRVSVCCSYVVRPFLTSVNVTKRLIDHSPNRNGLSCVFAIF